MVFAKRVISGQKESFLAKKVISGQKESILAQKVVILPKKSHLWPKRWLFCQKESFLTKTVGLAKGLCSLANSTVRLAALVNARDTADSGF